MPFTLNPLETRNLIIRFTPLNSTADTSISAVLEIASDDGDEAVKTVLLSDSVDVVVNNIVAAQVDSNSITTTIIMTNFTPIYDVLSVTPYAEFYG